MNRWRWKKHEATIFLLTGLNAKEKLQTFPSHRLVPSAEILQFLRSRCCLAKIERTFRCHPERDFASAGMEFDRTTDPDSVII